MRTWSRFHMAVLRDDRITVCDDDSEVHAYTGAVMELSALRLVELVRLRDEGLYEITRAVPNARGRLEYQLQLCAQTGLRS